MAHEWHTRQSGRLSFTKCSKCGSPYDEEHMGRRCAADSTETADISSTEVIEVLEQWQRHAKHASSLRYAEFRHYPATFRGVSFLYT